MIVDTYPHHILRNLIYLSIRYAAMSLILLAVALLVGFAFYLHHFAVITSATVSGFSWGFAVGVAVTLTVIIYFRLW